jgi:hypothetical protein
VQNSHLKPISINHNEGIQAYKSADPVSNCTLKVFPAIWIGTSHSTPSVSDVGIDAVTLPPAAIADCEVVSSLRGTASPALERRDRTRTWDIISMDNSPRPVTVAKKRESDVFNERD